VDITAAAMLLGGVTFVMMLFQLVNVDDDDIRRYAWKVISDTVSIFMAVLFFQGNNEMLELAAEQIGLREVTTVFIHFFHCLLYVLVLLIFIGWNSGVWEKDGSALDVETWVVADAMLVKYGEGVPEDKVRAVIRNDHESRKSVYTDEYGLEVAVVKKHVEYETRKRRNACWATLIAHMAGFASIGAGGSMQQSEFFNRGPVVCFIPVLVTLLVLIAFFQLSALYREKLRQEAVSFGRKGRRAKMVHEAVGEAENDILSLAASFLTVQVIRFAITGQLPNAEGLEEPVKFDLTLWHVSVLAGVGFGFCIACMLIARGRSMMAGGAQGQGHGNKEEEEEEGVSVRILEVLMSTVAMCFAWCALICVRWAWELHPFLGIKVLSIIGRIMLALILSLLTFLVVYVLDSIHDRLRASEADTKTSEHAISAIIGAVSVLVGFSWEHSFDGAVTAVADLNQEYPQCTKFVLGICVFGFLLRPWRRYILMRSLQLESLKTEREKSVNKMVKDQQESTHRTEASTSSLLQKE